MSYVKVSGKLLVLKWCSMIHKKNFNYKAIANNCEEGHKGHGRNLQGFTMLKLGTIAI